MEVHSKMLVGALEGWTTPTVSIHQRGRDSGVIRILRATIKIFHGKCISGITYGVTDL